MSQIREQVKKEDKVVKEHSQHQSQSDAAKGFGGRYGVQKERQDKVCIHKNLHARFKYLASAGNRSRHAKSQQLPEIEPTKTTCPEPLVLYH